MPPTDAGDWPVEWRDPPDRPPRRSALKLVQRLSERPGQWALVETFASAHVRRGRVRTMRNQLAAHAFGGTIEFRGDGPRLFARLVPAKEAPPDA